MPLLWTSGLSMISLLLLKFAAGYFYRDDRGSLYLFRQSLPLRLLFNFCVIGAFVLLDRLLYYVHIRQEENKRKSDLEKISKDAELSLLRQQLQPHFLFNTLNSISSLIGTQPEEARKMIQQLSDFFRATVRKDDQNFVDLGSELTQLQLYLDIEKLRFGDRLTVQIDTENSCLALRLPPLLLQPLVENAIKFGLYGTYGNVLIRIGVWVEKEKTGNGNLIVQIENPFDPQTAQSENGTGFGLRSVKRRLYLLFSRNDLVQTRINDQLFAVTLKLPQTKS